MFGADEVIMIESGLYSLITANAGFVALAADRLYPLVLPDSLTASTTLPPSATYQVISSITDYTNDGSTGCTKARIQFDCLASDYADAKNLTDAIRLVLDGYAGILPDGTPVAGTWVINVTDSYSQDTRLYRVSTDYRIVYAQQ